MYTTLVSPTTHPTPPLDESINPVAMPPYLPPTSIFEIEVITPAKLLS